MDVSRIFDLTDNHILMITLRYSREDEGGGGEEEGDYRRSREMERQDI